MKRIIPLAIVLITLGGLISCSKSRTETIQKPTVDIWTAAATGNTAELQLHIDSGSDLNEGEPQGGSSPMIVAALIGQAGSVRMLADAGANVNAVNNDGSTALHTAAFFCKIDVVKALLDKGADTSIKNAYGRTALESVSDPWSEQLAGVYQMIAGGLQIPIDLKQIQAERPEIAAILAKHDAARQAGKMMDSKR